jgi:acetyl-CoA carboxylase biotin carboxyl carrier protein
VSDLTDRVETLCELMEEFGLQSAEWKGKEWAIEMRRDAPAPLAAVSTAPTAATPIGEPRPARKTAKASKPKAEETGTPVASPMTGIYYGSPSPGAPPFVKVGQTVQAGDTVALIEAMKVFNEITAPVSGVVSAVKVENGQLVETGDVLIRIG